MDQEGRYPSAAPGEDFASDGTGRPTDPDLRVLALASLLTQQGLSASPGNLQALAFWEEAIAGLLGCQVDSLGFASTPDGPRSATLVATVERWVGEGALTRSAEFDADLDPALHPSEESFAKGYAVRGDEPGSEWWRTLHGFAWGLRSVEDGDPTVVPGRDSADIRSMVLCDPIFVEGAWVGSGPASVSIDMGQVSPDLEGRSGSVLEAVVAAMSAARVASGLSTPDPAQSAYAYAKYLCKRASEGDPGFGERNVVLARDDLRVGETRTPDGVVNATFLDSSNEVVATLSYVPDDRVVRIEVAQERRGTGIGTVALRHAMAAGARNVPPHPGVSTGLFARHGHALPDGGYALTTVPGVPGAVAGISDGEDE